MKSYKIMLRDKDHSEPPFVDKRVSIKIFSTKLIGTEGARLLREKRILGRPRRRKGAEKAPGPPAESEFLEWKSRSNLTTPQ